MAFLKSFIKSFAKIFGLNKNTPRFKILSKRKSSSSRSKPTKKNSSSPSKKNTKNSNLPRVKSKAKKIALGKSSPKSMPPVSKQELVGDITHYFSKIKVVVVKVTKGTIKVGNTIHIKGNRSDFDQKITSMQIESEDVKQAKKGQIIGLKVVKEANVGDKVYLLSK